MKYHFIYKVTCLINGLIYVGHHSTNNLNDKYLGGGAKFKKAIKDLGKENFVRIVLEYCNYEDLSSKEKFWQVELDCTNPLVGYNVHIKGTGQKVGYKHREDSKEKMKLNRPDISGENNPMFGRTGELNPMYGVHKLGKDNPLFGTTRSEESKLKQHNAMTGRFAGENNPFFGKTHSKEKMDQIKESKRKRFEEFGNPLKGTKKSPEACQRYKEAWTRRKVITCEYCGLESKNASNMIRYHGPRCKSPNNPLNQI